MQTAGSPELARLLAAGSADELDRAWTAFVDRHSGLLLHTIRTVVKGHDDRMDAYAFVLDHLRRDDCVRLRRYTADGRAEFTTWLVVVTRRLGIDFLRSRHGRVPATSKRPLSAVTVDPSTMIGDPPDPTENPLARLVSTELATGLERALAQLDDGDRLVLALRYQDQRTAREIAAILGLPSPFHAYRRAAAALTRLRRLLDQAGIDSPDP